MNKLELKIPRDAKYFSSVRLFISAISSEYFNFDEMEDIKMAVSEGLNISLISSNEEYVKIEIEILKEEFKVKISEVLKDRVEEKEELLMPITIIECLVDKCEFSENSLIIIKDM